MQSIAPVQPPHYLAIIPITMDTNKFYDVYAAPALALPFAQWQLVASHQPGGNIDVPNQGDCGFYRLVESKP